MLASVLCLGACSQQVSVCTLIGCDSGVTFELTGVKATGAGPFSVHACVDSVCVDQKLAGLTQAQVVTKDSATRTATASITVTEGSKVLARGSVLVTTKKIAPNGESCGPICFVADVTVTNARLTVAP